MIALCSYTAPRDRDLRRQRFGRALATIALVVSVCAVGLVVAHVTLNTLVALPNLTVPPLGCC